MAGGEEAGGVYGGGAFSDSSLSSTVLDVAAAAGASFSFVEGLAVYRSQIVRFTIAITVMKATRTTTPSPEAEERKPARWHLAVVRRVLWCTVTFPIIDFV